jgi:hypothetical protein
MQRKLIMIYAHVATPDHRQIHYMKVSNKSFENLAKFKYLRMRITNKDPIHEKIRNTKCQEMFVNMLFRIFCLLPAILKK